MHKFIDKCPAENCRADFDTEKRVATITVNHDSGEADLFTHTWTATCINGHCIDVQGRLMSDGKPLFLVAVPEVIRTATKTVGPCIACQFPIEPGQKYFMQVQKHVRC